ncbi:MAG: MFS transporter [Conexivisphaerales archaeon]
MVEYKWVALSNTTLGVLMASINGTIILISLPAIFRGLAINPLSSFQYLLWVLFGYNIATATLLVTFGRLSDIFGRVRLYNLGFAIFTVGSILLFITPGTGDFAAIELVFFRLIQGVGGAFLFANSAAVLTDAFPAMERGKALGINQVAFLAGSLIGLVIGGILASFNWRYVFLVSVPFGIAGTLWSYLKLKEISALNRNQKIDAWGNTTFAVGLTLILIGVTYGLIPYGSSPMGWSDPWVIAAIAVGVFMMLLFPFIESRVEQPLFRLELFKIRMFSAASFAAFLSSIGQGGLMLLLIILLQGIWLPLHGYSYSSTPFWSGIYMIPMTLGFVTMGPLSGWLSDRYGSKLLSTLGLIITAFAFVALSFLQYNFVYLPFAIILFFMGIGNGMFASPNTASLMNSVPPEHRGVASGMRATMQNTGQTISLAVFFVIIIGALTQNLPQVLSSALVTVGAPQLAPIFSHISPTGALFAAFLGYNPMSSVLQQISSMGDPQLVNSIPPSVINTLTSTTWFPNAIAPAFMSALKLSFYVGAALSLVAAIFSALRGNPFIYELHHKIKTN